MRKTRKHEIKNVDLLAAKKQGTSLEVEPEINNFPQQQDFKQLSRQKKRKKRKRIMIAIFVILGLLAGLFLFLKSSYFDIKEIKVEGMNYYSDSEIISMSGAETGRNILFDSEKVEIIEALEGNPYFKEVKVKRKLPSTLLIQVDERPQTAAIIFGGSFVVIDDEGVVLRKTDVDPKLTLLNGLTISKMTVGETVEAEEKEILSMTLRMLKTMTDGDMYFKRIDVSKLVIRAYVYDNLIVKGTPGEITDAIENGQLQKVVTNLFEQDISRGTIVMGGSSYMSFSPELDAD